MKYTKMDPQHNSNEIVHRNNSHSNEYLVSWSQSEPLTWMLSFDVHTACEMRAGNIPSLTGRHGG